MQLFPSRELGVHPFREVADARRAIVFIHGFGGDAVETWEQFARCLGNSEGIHDWDILSIAYPAIPLPWVFRSWNQVVVWVRGLLKSPRFTRYKSIALITHAEGGLVAQRLLAEDEALAARVSHAFFFASPNAGLRIPFLSAFRFLLDLPLGWLFGFNLVQSTLRFLYQPIFELVPGSEYLRDLNERWTKQFGQSAPFQYLAVQGLNDVSVSPDSLYQFAAGHQAAIPGDHMSLVRPDNAGDVTVQVVVSGLLEANPVPTLRPAPAGVLQVAAQAEAERFDVFLYHSFRANKDVQVVSDALRERGLRPWFAPERILPGKPYLPAARSGIQHTARAAVIFIAKSEPSGEERDEVMAALQQQGLTLIPALLPEYGADEPKFAPPLKGLMPVDIDPNDPASIDNLARAIRGQVAYPARQRRTKGMGGESNQSGIIAQALKAVPVLRYALGIAAIIAIVAQVTTGNMDLRTALLLVPVVIGLMLLLYLFEKFVERDSVLVRILASVVAVIFVAVFGLIASSWLFGYPKPLAQLLSEPAAGPHPNVPKRNTKRFELRVQERPAGSNLPGAFVSVTGVQTAIETQANRDGKLEVEIPLDEEAVNITVAVKGFQDGVMKNLKPLDGGQYTVWMQREQPPPPPPRGATKANVSLTGNWAVVMPDGDITNARIRPPGSFDFRSQDDGTVAVTGSFVIEAHRVHVAGTASRAKLHIYVDWEGKGADGWKRADLALAGHTLSGTLENSSGERVPITLVKR